MFFDPIVLHKHTMSILSLTEEVSHLIMEKGDLEYRDMSMLLARAILGK